MSNRSIKYVLIYYTPKSSKGDFQKSLFDSLHQLAEVRMVKQKRRVIDLDLR